MILPAMGVDHGSHHLLRAAARLRLHASWSMRCSRSRPSASSSGAITCSSSGQSPYAGLVFSLLSFLVAVPSAIKVFNWTATLFRGQITFEAPMLYALGFVGLFTIGGLTGLFLASHSDRRARARHLLRDRAFPLHHGGRIGVGALRRRCTSGGRRSRASCIRNRGRASRRS